MQEGFLRKMSDRALLGRFLSSYLCYTKEKQFGSVKERGSIEGMSDIFLNGIMKL